MKPVRGWLVLVLIVAALGSASLNVYQHMHRQLVLNIVMPRAAPHPHGPRQAPTPPQQVHEYDTMDEAAVAALRLSYGITPAYEVGGIIAKLPDGKFAIGKPNTDLSGDSISSIDLDPLNYPGVIVAWFHTHPCMPNTHLPTLFSPPDLATSRTYRYPGYMANLCTGKVAKYDPAVDQLTAEEVHEGWQGPIVGSFAVDGTALDVNLAEIS